MDYQLKKVRLDKLNIPGETLRQSSMPADDLKLEESLKTHGVLAPLVITELGRGEYAVWDGTRRVKTLRKLGTPGSKMLPAIVMKGGDRESVIAQLAINQVRARLSVLAEVEGLRQLVREHGMNQKEAAALMLKTKSWASKVMRIWKLPAAMQKSMRKGEIALAHAANYVKVEAHATRYFSLFLLKILRSYTVLSFHIRKTIFTHLLPSALTALE